MTTQSKKSGRRQPGAKALSGRPEEVVDRLAELLPGEELERALEGLEPEQVTGPGGLVSQLAGRVIETALGAELSEHLGYPPEAPPGGTGNHRNGSTRKTLQTELGPARVKTPRDRKGSFEPKLVAKRQTRPAGLDERILGLYAGGMSVRDIAHTCPTSTAARSAATRSAGSLTPCSRMSPPGARGRSRRSTRSSTSMPNGQGARGPQRAHPRLLPGGRRHRRGRARAARDLVARQRRSH
jgi:hypothetical protein